MKSARFYIILSFSVISAGLLLVSHPFAGAAFAADLALTFFLLRRKSMISFSLSLVPALMMAMACLGRSAVWAFVSATLTVLLFAIYKGRLPETRQTTDMWMGTLILTVLVCVSPFVLFG